MSPYLAGGILAFYIASCAMCGYLGYKYETADCTAADNAHDLAQSQNTVAAEKKVTSVVQKQGIISQEASNEYTKSNANVVAAYTGGVQSPPAGPVNGMPSVRSASGGTCTDSGHWAKTKVYKLTPQQCDQEEAKCNALWNWANQQASVAP